MIREKPSDEILTSKEAMAFLRLGRTTLWTLTKSGEIPSYRIGKGGVNSALRYFKSELVEWLRGKRCQPYPIL